MSENLLNKGDEVVEINRGFSGNVYYSFNKVVRVTKTTAILGNGITLRRYGNSWQLSTPQIKAAAAAERERQAINTWFKNYQFTDADKKTICELFKNRP